MTNAQELPEPTRCYVDGCDRENELMLHIADDPWLGGDFCLEHARALLASTPLILTCECPVLCASPADCLQPAGSVQARGSRALAGGDGVLGIPAGAR